MCSALESSLEVTGETAHSERAQGHYFKQCPLSKHSHFFHIIYFVYGRMNIFLSGFKNVFFY